MIISKATFIFKFSTQDYLKAMESILLLGWDTWMFRAITYPKVFFSSAVLACLFSHYFYRVLH